MNVKFFDSREKETAWIWLVSQLHEGRVLDRGLKSKKRQCIETPIKSI